MTVVVQLISLDQCSKYENPTCVGTDDDLKKFCANTFRLNILGSERLFDGLVIAGYAGHGTFSFALLHEAAAR